MEVNVKTKRVVICADDFGMNRAVNDGILRLAGMGRLSAASCLVQGPDFTSDAPALKRSGLELGLHVNFTEPMGQPGVYCSLGKLIAGTRFHRFDRASLRVQIVRQLDIFESTLGRAPQFIDGHQHVHQFPQIRDVLLEVLEQRYYASRPWLRYTGVRAAPGVSLHLRFKALVIASLGAHRFRELARARGFSLNRGFLGVYDFEGGRAGYQRLLELWLRSARDGDLLMCHPAFGEGACSSLETQRRAEFDVLAGEAMGRLLDRHGIKPAPFAATALAGFQADA